MADDKERNLTLGRQLQDLLAGLSSLPDKQRAEHDRRIEDLRLELLKANEGLARSRAHRYGRFNPTYAEDFEAVARSALYEAIVDWDPNRLQLASWAVRRIDRALRQAAAQAENLPESALRTQAEIRIAEKLLIQELGTEPSVEEIAAEAGTSVDVVIALRALRGGSDVLGEDHPLEHRKAAPADLDQTYEEAARLLVLQKLSIPPESSQPLEQAIVKLVLTGVSGDGTDEFPPYSAKSIPLAGHQVAVAMFMHLHGRFTDEPTLNYHQIAARLNTSHATVERMVAAGYELVGRGLRILGVSETDLRRIA